MPYVTFFSPPSFNAALKMLYFFINLGCQKESQLSNDEKEGQTGKVAP